MGLASPARHIAAPTLLYKFRRILVLRYEKYLPPLNTKQVSKCLKSFVLKTATALEELHNSYELAHLDARLPNICFVHNESQYEVMLIDLIEVKEAKRMPFDRTLVRCTIFPQRAHGFLVN